MSLRKSSEKSSKVGGDYFMVSLIWISNFLVFHLPASTCETIMVQVKIVENCYFPYNFNIFEPVYLKYNSTFVVTISSGKGGSPECLHVSSTLRFVKYSSNFIRSLRVISNFVFGGGESKLRKIFPAFSFSLVMLLFLWTATVYI